jgi:hypothetical protein
MLAAFMPYIIGGLASAVGTLVGRVLISMGIGFVTYTGIDLALTELQQLVISGVQGLPADMVSLIGFLWLDKALSVIFSAITTAVGLRYMGGSVKKMVYTPSP